MCLGAPRAVRQIRRGNGGVAGKGLLEIRLPPGEDPSDSMLTDAGRARVAASVGRGCLRRRAGPAGRSEILGQRDRTDRAGGRLA